MTRTMYDSVNPHNIPQGSSMVAGYVDGVYANVGSMQRLFPNAVVVRIAVSHRTNDGHVLDVEEGDATPKGALAWVKMRREAGADPSVYCSASIWPAVRKVFIDDHTIQPHYWVAQWDGVKEVPTGAVAKQFTDGPKFDTSIVLDRWPGVDAPNNPRPVPSPSFYTVKKGDTLSEIAVHFRLTVRKLMELNPHINNPDLIRVGDKIRISGKHVSPHVNAHYEVRAGDTLSGIAAEHRLTLAQIEMLNPQIKDPNVIFVGQIITL